MIRLLSRVLIMTLWIPMAGLAQTAASAAAAGKIVFLNVDTAVLSCDEGKNEFAEVQKFVDDKTAELKNLSAELDSLNNQLSAQRSKLTDEARADLEWQVTTKDTQAKRFQQDTQQEINNKRDRVYAFILKKMQLVIDKVARDKGYAAVLVMNPNRDIWVDPTLDITDDMVKAYNATYPVSKPKPAAPPQ